jgi:hypothetical protein
VRVPRSPIVLAVAAALVAACAASTPSTAPSGSPGGTGSPAPSPGASPSPLPAASAALLLRATSEGGFIGPAATLAALPAVSVYADGEILTPAPQPTVTPGPLVPMVQVRDVGAAGVAAIVAAIRAAGLDTPASDAGGVAADTGTTVIAVTLDGTTVTTRFRGMGGGPQGPGGAGGPGAGSPDPRQAAALALLARLEDTGDPWGAAAAPVSTLEPAGYRVYAAPGAPPADLSVATPTVAWPLATPLASFGTPAPADRGIEGLRQGVALGADAAALAPVLAAATMATGFTSGGTTWTLYVRPLLPDELGR